MKNKPKPASPPKKQPKSALIKTPAVKAALSGKKKKLAEITDKKKIGPLEKAKLRKMERELRKTKERLRLLSEAAEEGIAVHYNGLIIEANDALARIFGYELSEMIGMNAKRLATPESWKVIKKHIAAGYDKPYESAGLRKDGTTFTCSLVGKPYKYKGRTVRLSTFRDITERKQAEEKLRREEERFRALAEQSSDIIVFVNRDGIVTYENPAMEKLLGFKPEERIGVNLFDRIHPDDLKFARDMFNQFTVNTSNTSSKDINSPVRQIRIRHQNGSWRIFETSASKLLNGNIVETVIINVRDITERKRAEEALRNEKDYNKILIQASPTFFVTITPEGKTMMMNEAMLQAIGYALDEVVGKDYLTTFVPESNREMLLKVFQTLVKNKKPTINNNYLLTRDGRQLLVEWHGRFVFNKNEDLDFFFGVGIDITERKEAEEALKRTQLLNEAILESVPGILYLYDDTGHLVHWNKQHEILTGYSGDEIKGRYILDWFGGIEPDTSNIKKSLSEVMEKEYASAEGHLITKNGNSIFMFFTGVKLSIAGKDHLLGIGVDITERKKAEEELKRYREHLEELVRERTIKLEAANKELEAFSYSASHDLRAPLRSIDGFSKALLEDCEDKLDIQGKDYLIRIRAAIRRMAELIEDLLQLSRITRTEMDIEKINLTRIARFVIDELQKSQPQRIVDTRIAEGMEETADSKLMRIVLENLLGNAWKFTEKQAKAVIEFGCTKKGEKKVYFIRDNGVGFDMDYADKLFAPFQRLHTEEEFPGTGIGLATVRRIIHRHGGKIWTEGQTGKGATFYFSLNEK